jgi:aminoglycoside 6'-N-acetyltransferase
MADTMIHGERTMLRPVSPADLDLLAGWLADPGVYEFWGGAPLDRETVDAQFIGGRYPGVQVFIIVADGRPIGYIQFWHTDDDPTADNGGIDMVLLPAERGRGLGPDAARAIIDYLIRERGWRRVTVDPALDNPAAIRAWARAGFVADHEQPDHPDGPALIMAIAAETWNQAASGETPSRPAH